MRGEWLRKACFLTNFLITKSRLSNTKILCEEHVKLETFLGYFQLVWYGLWFFNSYVWFSVRGEGKRDEALRTPAWELFKWR